MLTPQEEKALFATLDSMVKQGLSIIFITHKLHEVMEASNRVTVLRGGKVVGTVKTSETNETELAKLIRPSGFFNVKAKRVKAFISWLFSRYEGNLSKMFAQDLQSLRSELLAVKGIGPETADSILLYAGNMPTFVVDAYTHRIFSRHELIPEESTYDEMKSFFEENLPEDVQLFNEYHALLVNIGKTFCKTKKVCEPCPLKDL